MIRAAIWSRDRGQCALCPNVLPRDGRWEADHIVPISEGGGLCGLDGYRTLCRPCHGKVTGDLRRRLRTAKKVQSYTV